MLGETLGEGKEIDEDFSNMVYIFSKENFSSNSRSSIRTVDQGLLLSKITFDIIIFSPKFFGVLIFSFTEQNFNPFLLSCSPLL